MILFFTNKFHVPIVVIDHQSNACESFLNIYIYILNIYIYIYIYIYHSQRFIKLSINKLVVTLPLRYSAFLTQIITRFATSWRRFSRNLLTCFNILQYPVRTDVFPFSRWQNSKIEVNISYTRNTFFALTFC